jgi:quercetin dioxygenase-like cupin family protein
MVKRLEKVSHKNLKVHLARYRTRTADWDAFTDARLPGYRRAQLRYVGSGASGKKDENIIPAYNFTLAIMYVPVGEGNAPHIHEVEEVFFVLKGHLTVFLEDGHGNRVEERLGPWDCISCPPNVAHGYQNNGLEPVFLQVMLGNPRSTLIGYTDPELQNRRDEHLRSNETERDRGMK